LRYLLAIFVFLALITLGCEVSTNNEGRLLYESHCSGCHGAAGEGLGKLVPPVAESDFWRDSANWVPCWIVNGRHTPVVVNGLRYEQPMPAAEIKKPTEIANIMNYIETKWYGGKRFWSDQTVQKRIEGTSCYQ
jgi:cytochrome c551